MEETQDYVLTSALKWGVATAVLLCAAQICLWWIVDAAPSARGPFHRFYIAVWSILTLPAALVPGELLAESATRSQFWWRLVVNASVWGACVAGARSVSEFFRVGAPRR